MKDETNVHIKYFTMEKLFKDRLNCLKSRLKSLKGNKMDKCNNDILIAEHEGRIKELMNLQYLLNKNKLNEK